MNASQWLSVLGSIGLILVLYFGFDTKPKEQKELERTRTFVAESADIQVLVKDAKEELGPSQTSEILRLETELASTLADSSKIAYNKNLSGEWYRLGKYAIAGFYAQEVAELEQSEASWSIAGTSYTIALQRSQMEKERDFALKRAIQAFENAISLNPSNSAHQVNLALVYTEQPPEENPMKGIQMLLQLNQEQPENVLVLNTLARLAIRTGQLERATERLEKALSIEVNNRNTICLLATVYKEREMTTKAQQFEQQCQAMQ